MAEKRKPWTAGALLDLLRARYAPPSFAFVEEVRRGTGSLANRSADAMALSLWPSRGVFFHGFELKVSRADWRRERDNPEKAEEMAALCRYWWIVAPAGVVPVEEVPDNWGLLETSDEPGGLVQSRAAKQLEEKACDINLTAAILRRFTAAYTPNHVLEQRAAEITAANMERRALELQHTREDLEPLRERVHLFEAASGVEIGERYSFQKAERIGEAVRYVLDRGTGRLADDLERVAETANRVAAKAAEEAAKVRAEIGLKEVANG